MIRMSDHAALLEFARHAKVPVINGLTDHSHPCQIMADLMTIEEKLGSIEGRKIVWYGDFNNVAYTFAQASSIWGFDLLVSCPEDLKPTGVSYEPDALKAAEGADVIVTDTWISMGQEGKNIDKFWPYQVNEALMARAKPGAIFMHCMPVHRGEEVTNEVLATKASVIYDEAENRLHAQKAILAWCLGESGVQIKKAA
jgi:ornithine carbamoyltransferase